MTNFNDAPYLTNSIVLPEDYGQLIIRLNDLLTSTFLQINQREISIYSTAETVTGQVWSSDNTSNPDSARTTFRKIYLFGAIAAGATLNIPLAIDFLSSITKWYGTIVTDVPDERPLPYVDDTAVNAQVSIKRVGTNLVIINGSGGAPNITSGRVIIEYLKN